MTNLHRFFTPHLEPLESREGPSAMNMLSALASSSSSTSSTAQQTASQALTQLRTDINKLNADFSANASTTTISNDVNTINSQTNTVVHDLQAVAPQQRSNLDSRALNLAAMEVQDGIALFSRGVFTANTTLASSGVGLFSTGSLFAVTAADFLFMDTFSRIL